MELALSPALCCALFLLCCPLFLSQSWESASSVGSSQFRLILFLLLTKCWNKLRLVCVGFCGHTDS